MPQKLFTIVMRQKILMVTSHFIDLDQLMLQQFIEQFVVANKSEQIFVNLAIKALEMMEGFKFDIDMSKLKEDKYAWLQVIEMQPKKLLLRMK